MRHLYQHMPREVVFINNGELYKAPSSLELHETYGRDPEGSPVFPGMKADGKVYRGSLEFKAVYSVEGRDPVDMTAYDLCPAVDLWLAVGAIEGDDENYDLFFDATSTDCLHSVSEFYGLPYPIPLSVEDDLNNHRDMLSLYTTRMAPHEDPREIVVGSVKYVNGNPAVLKLYIYPRDNGNGLAYMTGHCYHKGGQEREWGGVYYKRAGGNIIQGRHMRGHNNFNKAEWIEGELSDGTKVVHKFTELGGARDPIVQWYSVEGDRIKRFESSKMWRALECNLTNGATLEQYDLCPDINFWLGRSYFEDGGLEEVYFHSENSALLEMVAVYYSLPVPYDDELKDRLDNDPESLRMRHYDINGEGEGKFVPVVVSSIIFDGDQAVGFRIYEFLRT
jgi:hypothetical protein